MSGKPRLIYSISLTLNFISTLIHARPIATINAISISLRKSMVCQKIGGRRVFCNPPYSNISEWVEKAYRESQQDHTLVVLLIPARTDTRYFHDYIYQRSEIRFIKGRLKFSGKGSAPFPSMIVIFRGAKI